jgi:hypothetical protein
MACRDDGAACGPCSGDTVCVGSSCETAFPRSYDFTIGALTMPPLDNSGGGWDGLTDNTPPIRMSSCHSAVVVTASHFSSRRRPATHSRWTSV